MVYTTPRPDDDAQLAAWYRRQAEDAVRSINIRLLLGLARRAARRGGRAACQAGHYVGDLLRAALGDLPGGPPLAPTPPAAPAPVDPGRVGLRDLRIIQLHTGRDSAPRPLDTADKATVLRLLRADLAWVERADRDDDGGGA